jgi:hypothetical protein
MPPKAAIADTKPILDVLCWTLAGTAASFVGVVVMMAL